MNEKVKFERRNNRNNEIRALVKKAKSICSKFFQDDYQYSTTEAVEELGLDDELIQQLVEDYVIQVINSLDQFEELIFELQSSKDAKQDLDYTTLRELAHKNLGVARNLRIKDAEILLNDLMKKDELEHLFRCIEVLQACTVKLRPESAFKTMKLIQIKSTF